MNLGLEVPVPVLFHAGRSCLRRLAFLRTTCDSSAANGPLHQRKDNLETSSTGSCRLHDWRDGEACSLDLADAGKMIAMADALVPHESLSWRLVGSRVMCYHHLRRSFLKSTSLTLNHSGYPIAPFPAKQILAFLAVTYLAVANDGVVIKPP